MEQHQFKSGEDQSFHLLMQHEKHLSVAWQSWIWLTVKLFYSVYTLESSLLSPVIPCFPSIVISWVIHELFVCREKILKFQGEIKQ